jgi:serine/threonine protein kinase/cytochrome c-type biogenesis protein CcmH/NrfG
MKTGPGSQADSSGAEYNVGDNILGRWKVHKVLGGRGRSGMGIVYIVQDREAGSKLAAKTFQPQFVSNMNVRKMLRREAEFWYRLGRHPNIVNVRFVESFGSQIYIFMEYVAPDESGRNTLNHYLTGRPLAAPLVYHWAVNLCEGMMHMQSKGLASHRDLKPDNLMITADKHLKITDFGLAKVRFAQTGSTHVPAQPASQTGLSVMGKVVGTPGYIAPEIIEGERGDIRSDIYAFGLILHQMVTGRTSPPLTVPFSGNPWLYELGNLDLRREQHVQPSGSPFDDVIQSCLEFDPQHRFQSFEKIKQHINELPGETINLFHLLSDEERQSKQKRHRALSGGGLIDQATAQYRLGNTQEALNLIQQARRTYGASAAIWNSEGVFYTDLGRYREALDCFDRSIALSPKWVMNRSNKGRALRHMGDPEKAIQCYDDAVRLDPDHAPPWTSKGNCLVDMKQYAEAIQCFEKALDKDHNWYAAWYGKSEALFHLKRYSDARTCIEKALALEPDDKSLIVLQKKIKDAQKYEDDQRARISIPPLQQYLSKAVNFYTQRQYQAALDCVQQARHHYGPTLDIRIYTGVFLHELGRLQEALACFDEILESHPDCIQAWNNKGMALRAMKRVEDALACYGRAILLDPAQWQPWLGKANCLADLGRMEAAASCYERALEIDPHSEKTLASCRNTVPDLYYYFLVKNAIQVDDHEKARAMCANIKPGSIYFQKAQQFIIAD